MSAHDWTVLSIGAALGWLCRGWIEGILVRVGDRLLTSGYGKAKVLEALRAGIERHGAGKAKHPPP